MLDRVRDIVKRLELPVEDDIVYRILDDDLNAVEVTEAQYARWRLQHDVAERAVLKEDSEENVTIRTTFSIMPENRTYKPFGTAAYTLPYYDLLSQYSKRYDTWQEALRGHAITLEQVKKDFATARAVDERAAALEGTAGAVRLAVSAGVPSLFQVHVHSEDVVTVHTPLQRASGSGIDVSVAATAERFKLSGAFNPSISVANELSEKLGVTVADGTVTSYLNGEDELPRGIIRVAQAVARISALSAGESGS